MQDFINEARFQAALLFKANTSDLKVAVRKMQAAILHVKTSTYSREEMHRLLQRHHQQRPFFGQGQPKSEESQIIEDKMPDILFADDNLVEESSQKTLSSKVENWMGLAGIRLTTMEERLTQIEERITYLKKKTSEFSEQSLESDFRIRDKEDAIHTHNENTPGVALVDGTEGVIITDDTCQLTDGTKDTPLRSETDQSVQSEASLKTTMQDIPTSSNTETCFVPPSPVGTNQLKSLQKSHSPRSTKIPELFRTPETPDKFIPDTFIPKSKSEKCISGTESSNTTPSKQDFLFITGYHLPNVNKTDHSCTEQGSRVTLKVQDQQRQLDQMVTQLKHLEVSTNNIAEQLVEKKVTSTFDHINEVDARLQSLAEQVVQLVGGEHARLTQAERSIQHLTENYSRLDEENKVLRDQLVRQQQHSNLQIEELLDNAQRHKSIATTKNSSNEELQTLHRDIHSLKVMCTDQERNFQVETQLLISELKRHKELYRDMLCEYTLLLHDSFKVLRRVDHNESLSHKILALHQNRICPTFSLPIRGGRRNMASGATMLENLKLKEENSHLKSITLPINNPWRLG